MCWLLIKPIANHCGHLVPSSSLPVFLANTTPFPLPLKSMFSSATKFIQTTCNISHCQLIQFGHFSKGGLLASQVIKHHYSCSSIAPTRAQDTTLAGRRQSNVPFYWNSIRKRFQSNESNSKSSAKSTKRTPNNKMDKEPCWETTTTTSSSSTSGEGEEITVMSYNILSQHLLDVHFCLYEQHKRNHLAWDHRLRLIVKHIESIAPQVLCLQEVECSHLSELVKRLARLGLDQHVYKKRTSQEYKDGCAIFYRSDSYNLVEFHRLEFFQPGIKVTLRSNIIQKLK